MKQFVSLLLALMLLTGIACASVEVTLPEKMIQQINVGGGVKGTATMTVSGSAPWLDWLLPLTGQEWNIRYIKQAQGDAFQARLFALDDQERARAVTHFYGDAQQLYLQTELLPDTLLTLPLQGASGNATIYSALLACLSIPEALRKDTADAKGWPAALAPYEQALDAWLEAHAAAPTVMEQEDGSLRLMTSYELSAQEIKAQMKTMLAMLMQDALMQEKLGALMTQEQRALYLNPALLYYYEYLIDAMPLNQPMLLTRELTAMGVVVNSSLTIPLPPNAGGWTELLIGQSGNEKSYALKSEQCQTALVVSRRVANAENTFWTGTLRYIPAEGEKTLLSYELRRYRTTTEDAERRSYEKTLWELSAKAEQPDGETGYAQMDPISVTLQTVFSSKHLNQNPTTLEASLSASLPGAVLTLNATLKTASAWDMQTLSTENARSVTALTEQEASGLLESYLNHAVSTMLALTIGELPAPEEPTEPDEEPGTAATDLMTATTTDLPE